MVTNWRMFFSSKILLFWYITYMLYVKSIISLLWFPHYSLCFIGERRSLGRIIIIQVTMENIKTEITHIYTWYGVAIFVVIGMYSWPITADGGHRIVQLLFFHSTTAGSHLTSQNFHRSSEVKNFTGLFIQ